MAHVGIAGTVGLPQRPAGVARGAKVGRVGDVERKQAATTAAQKADQDIAPTGVGALRHRQLAIHKVAAHVVGVAQARHVRQQAAGGKGKALVAGAGVKGVQKAAVGAHEQGGVVAHIHRRRMDDVAQHRGGAVAQRAAVAHLAAGVAAQVVDHLLACGVGGAKQIALCGREPRPVERHRGRAGGGVGGK